ncbi:MAG: Hsp20/alpha crystallin family protein [Casimicrobium sp.]|jgi:HSP20 family protein
MTGFIRFNGAPAVRWAPFAANTRTHAEFERAFAEAYGERGDKKAATELRADVRENATAYIVQFDVPGVAKEDITVDVDEKSVRVEATFKRETVEGDASVLTERSEGAISRAFRLSQAVDAELATARHEHGVLTLTLPKKNVAVQKRLEIN